MTNDGFIYSFKASGIERKQVASAIAEALDGEVKYQGPPSFSYQVTGWTIDKAGIVKTPEIQKGTLRTVLDALKAANAIGEGNGTVTFSLQGHTGNTLRNVINLIWSKQALIQKSLGRQETILPESLVNAINAVPIDTLEDFAKVINEGIDAGAIIGDSDLDFDIAEKALSFNFSNASLDSDEVFAFIALCQQISEQAKKQKFSSTKQKDVENECYSMRCFLLKLGFIGEAYKAERKILLSNLDGNAAYRTIEAQQAAEEKRKAHVLTERSENR
ncbi:MAG: hypothetical protein ACYCVD_16955 [Desulfitobacteriaceae bacterium]